MSLSRRKWSHSNASEWRKPFNEWRQPRDEFDSRSSSQGSLDQRKNRSFDHDEEHGHHQKGRIDSSPLDQISNKNLGVDTCSKNSEKDKDILMEAMNIVFCTEPKKDLKDLEWRGDLCSILLDEIRQKKNCLIHEINELKKDTVEIHNEPFDPKLLSDHRAKINAKWTEITDRQKMENVKHRLDSDDEIPEPYRELSKIKFDNPQEIKDRIGKSKEFFQNLIQTGKESSQIKSLEKKEAKVENDIEIDISTPIDSKTGIVMKAETEEATSNIACSKLKGQTCKSDDLLKLIEEETTMQKINSSKSLKKRDDPHKTIVEGKLREGTSKLIDEDQLREGTSKHIDEGKLREGTSDLLDEHEMSNNKTNELEKVEYIPEEFGIYRAEIAIATGNEAEDESTDTEDEVEMVPKPPRTSITATSFVPTYTAPLSDTELAPEFSPHNTSSFNVTGYHIETPLDTKYRNEEIIQELWNGLERLDYDIQNCQKRNILIPQTRLNEIKREAHNMYDKNTLARLSLKNTRPMDEYCLFRLDQREMHSLRDKYDPHEVDNFKEFEDAYAIFTMDIKNARKELELDLISSWAKMETSTEDDYIKSVENLEQLRKIEQVLDFQLRSICERNHKNFKLPEQFGDNDVATLESLRTIPTFDPKDLDASFIHTLKSIVKIHKKEGLSVQGFVNCLYHGCEGEAEKYIIPLMNEQVDELALEKLVNGMIDKFERDQTVFDIGEELDNFERPTGQPITQSIVRLSKLIKRANPTVDREGLELIENVLLKRIMESNTDEEVFELACEKVKNSKGVSFKKALIEAELKLGKEWIAPRDREAKFQDLEQDMHQHLNQVWQQYHTDLRYPEQISSTYAETNFHDLGHSDFDDQYSFDNADQYSENDETWHDYEACNFGPCIGSLNWPHTPEECPNAKYALTFL